jgi:hypothetical protein
MTRGEPDRCNVALVLALVSVDELGQPCPDVVLAVQHEDERPTLERTEQEASLRRRDLVFEDAGRRPTELPDVGAALDDDAGVVPLCLLKVVDEAAELDARGC